MKLYWFLGSQPARAVKCLLDVGKIPCELISVDIGKNMTRTKDFLSMNPLGQIPFLVDGDLKIGESNAILVYLCEKYPQNLKKWYGESALQRAIVNQHLSWYQSYFRPSLFKIIQLKIYEGIKKQLPVYADSIRQAENSMEKAMEQFQNLLAKGDTDFSAGKLPTIADLQYYFQITNFMVYELEFKKFQRINSWFKRMETIKYVSAITEDWLKISPEIIKILQSVKISQRSKL